MIAHRLSTIRNADNIVVLKEGKIIARGKQEELLATCPLYSQMWEAHIGARDWAVSVDGKPSEGYQDRHAEKQRKGEEQDV